jgi:hypothetical protein
VGALGWIRGASVGFGKGRRLAGRLLCICVVGTMRFGEEDVWWFVVGL